MKILKKLYIPFIAGILAITGFLMPTVNIEYSTDTGLHIGQAITVNAGSANVKPVSMKDTLSYALLEKSGCQIGKDGLIYLRYDLYLLPEADGFETWFITAAEQQAADMANEISTKGKVYEDYNTPYLSVFVSVPSSITAEEVKTLGNEIVNKSYAGLISTGSVMTSVNEVRPILKQAKVVAITTEKETSVLTKYSKLTDITDDVTIQELNPSNADTKSLNIVIGSKELPVYAGSPISVGAAAIDRAGVGTNGYTRIQDYYTATGTGFIDTIEIYGNTDMYGTHKAGTFYYSDGNFTCRDYENIGNVIGGAKRTLTGLSIDVEAGDYMGHYAQYGRIENGSGAGGVYYKGGDQFANTTSYSYVSSSEISIVGTGYSDTGEPVITNSTGASNVTATAARLNGELTDDGGDTTTVTVYWGDNDGGTTAGNWDNNYSLGTQAEGTFYHDVSSLSSGTTYYYRYYASNSYGGAWASSTESFLTKPAAPTNVSATDGTHTDKVVITWTKSTGATGYKIYEGSNLLATVGDVATFDDTTAAAPTITAGSAVASDGTSGKYVSLSLSGTSVSNGSSRTYKVVAFNATGDSADSSTDTGYRGYGTISYQWQVSAADSNANYSDIIAGTTASYNYTAAPDFPNARYYRCTISAVGASPQTTTADRGYKADFVAPIVTSLQCVGYGDTWAILKGYIVDQGDAVVTEVGFEYGLSSLYGSVASLTGTYNTGDYFVVFIDGLTNGTQYNYMAYANNGGTGYGANKYFSTSGSPVIYEYINENGDGDSTRIYGNGFGSQMFTVDATSHTITGIRLLLKATGDAGNIVVSIRHATATGLPTGNDIVSTIYDAANLPSAYAWHMFEIDETSLEANKSYCIVVKATAGDANNYIEWKQDTGGNGDDVNDFASTSTDGGITWTSESPVDYLFEVWGNSCIDLIGAKVFRSYVQDNDMLIVIQYTNVYLPYYPNNIASQYFDLVLYDTDGTTLLASNTAKSWDFGIGSIYLSADSAASLTNNSEYYVGIRGAFGSYPEDLYQLQSDDWMGSDLGLLDDYIIISANTMSDYYGVEMTAYVAGKGNVLNEEGGILVATGIPSLTIIRPDLFQVIIYVPTYDAGDWTLAYDLTNDWEAKLGSNTVDMLNSGASIIGISGKDLGIIGLIILYILLVAFVVMRHGNPLIATVLPIPIALLGAWIGLISFVVLGVIAAISMLLFVATFIWGHF